MVTDKLNEVIDMSGLEAEEPLPLLTEEAENYHLPVWKQLLCLFVADIFQKRLRASFNCQRTERVGPSSPLFPKIRTTGCSNQFCYGLIIGTNFLASILMIKLMIWMRQRRG